MGVQPAWTACRAPAGSNAWLISMKCRDYPAKFPFTPALSCRLCDRVWHFRLAVVLPVQSPGGWLGGRCPELPWLMQVRVSVTLHGQSPALGAPSSSFPRGWALAWSCHGVRAQLGWPDLPPEQGPTDLPGSPGHWFGLWQKLYKQRNLCGGSRITPCQPSVRLEGRLWGEMSGLPQLEVVWGQGWGSLSRGAAFGASQV